MSTGTSVTEATDEKSHDDGCHLPVADDAAKKTKQSFQKICTLGTYESSTSSANALLDFSTLPLGVLSPGSLVNIAPLDSSQTTTELDAIRRRDKDVKADDRTSATPQFVNFEAPPFLTHNVDPRRGHLFMIREMSAEIIAKYPGTQLVIATSDATQLDLKARSQVLISTVAEESYHASHVEISFRDEYLSRADMWRLVISELAGKVVRKGQRLAFMGTIKGVVKSIYIRGRKAGSALFTSSTKPIFRSESARYVVFIQMSKEMWDFDADGTGEIMFSKVINGFLPELFQRWQQVNARHLVTIVMFTRLQYEKGIGTIQDEARMTAIEPKSTDDARKTSFHDFYRVVVSDMPSAESSDILLQLKKEFRVFLRDVSVKETDPDDILFGSGFDAAKPSHIIAGHPSAATQGNILESVNLASSQFSYDYIDRDLQRTGVSVIVVTPGTGLFEVDYNLLAITTDNLIENAVGIDLVCLSRIPLHSVPLFKYRLPGAAENKHPSSITVAPSLPKTTLNSVLGQNSAIADLASSSPRYQTNVLDSNSDQWNYAIPHWVDVSFWTSTSEEDRMQAAILGMRDQVSSSATSRRPKLFIPRARMYELQMMGIMENAMRDIRLPYLEDPSSSSIQKKKDDQAHMRTEVTRKLKSGGSPSGRSMSRWASTSFQWMDDYDQMLFKHPKNRQSAASKAQRSQADGDRLRSRRQGSHSPTTFGSAPGSTGLPFDSRRGSWEHQGYLDRKIKERQPPSQNTIKAQRVLGKSTQPPSSTSKPVKLSRQISFGLRGIGVTAPKATASTEITNENSKIASITNLNTRPQPPKKAKSGLVSKSMVSKPSSITQRAVNTISAGEESESTESTASESINTSRPITIAGAAADIHRGSYHDSLNPAMKDPSRQLGPKIIPIQEDSKLNQLGDMSPGTAMAPWLTVINPSNPKKVDPNSTARLGRWQHVFPKRLRASKIKWKSLCSPAAMPLTTEDFPSADELVAEYQSSRYTINIPLDDELPERPRNHDWLVREMMAFRFSQGFQVVVGQRLIEASIISVLEDFSVFDDRILSNLGTTVVMSKGSTIHKLSNVGLDAVEVEVLSRYNIATNLQAKHTIYYPSIRTMLAEIYNIQDIAITHSHDRPDWESIDDHIAGHEKNELTHHAKNLRSWRARFILIPINTTSTARRPLQPLNEDNEEERRLEGIRKLTQVWQRYRFRPRSEAQFSTTMRKRTDTNPLDIMYQTRNPSEVIAAEKDIMGDEVSTGKAIQLLPESELFQRSNLNLATLAQTIQGEKGVRLLDRRWHLRLHYSCFIGFELTSWLLQNFRDIENREEAVELGNDLMKNNLFQHVEQRHNFRDGNYFYQIGAEYRTPRPESKGTWFGSRRPDKSVPSTPISDGIVDTPKAPASRSSSTEEKNDDDPSTPAGNKKRLGVALSKSLLYNVDHRKRSYRPELITLHYDRIHNPDNCYHIRLDWMNVTSKLIEDAIVSWATTVDRFGLKLVEVPIAEASVITNMHPFRAPFPVKLAQYPPRQQPQSYFDVTSFTPQPKIEKHFYQKTILKKFSFVLDFEAARDFPADVDVTYSWGKPDYKYPQYIHKSGTLLAQITDEGDFLLLANRLYNDRTAAPQEGSRPDDPLDYPLMPSRFGPSTAAPRTSNHRGSPHLSPYSSPHVRAVATADAPHMLPHSSPKTNPNTKLAPPSSIFATPEQITKTLEAFCRDAEMLDAFYNEVLSKSSSEGPGTPFMDSTIPILGLPESLVLRERSHGPNTVTLHTRSAEGSAREKEVDTGEDGRT
ncbi:MAG: hypothetical protein Q9167_004537 [Letrouitia subvulpina]